jgi:hypothetical protein
VSVNPLGGDDIIRVEDSSNRQNVLKLDLKGTRAAVGGVIQHVDGCTRMLELFKSQSKGTLSNDDITFLSSCTSQLTNSFDNLKKHIMKQSQTASPDVLMQWRELKVQLENAIDETKRIRAESRK